jgi:hypothetical protein
MATRRKEIEPPSSHSDGSKSFLGGRGQVCVPPLPCLRPYHAKIDLIWMEGCDLANTAWIFQSQLFKPSVLVQRTAGSSDLIPRKFFC